MLLQEGPRFFVKPVFVHALFGADRLSGTASVTGIGSEDLGSQFGFAMALGGGAQVPFAEHLAFRSSFDYLLSRHNIFGGPRVSQHNFRVGVGVVYLIGGSGNTSKSRNKRQYQEPETLIPQLGIKGEDTPRGFLISSVAPTSILVNQGVTPNDLFVSINGEKITSAAEARAKLPGPGTVKLGSMFTRSVYVEKTVELGR
jgi:membrane-associated protease RseP (regulator of RpoE activity)